MIYVRLFTDINYWFQVSAQPPAKKTASLIGKETDEVSDKVSESISLVS